MNAARGGQHGRSVPFEPESPDHAPAVALSAGFGQASGAKIACGTVNSTDSDGETPCGGRRSRQYGRSRMIFQMAEVAVPRGLFRAILERIWRLRLPEAVPR